MERFLNVQFFGLLAFGLIFVVIAFVYLRRYLKINKACTKHVTASIADYDSEIKGHGSKRETRFYPVLSYTVNGKQYKTRYHTALPSVTVGIGGFKLTKHINKKREKMEIQVDPDDPKQIAIPAKSIALLSIPLLLGLLFVFAAFITLPRDARDAGAVVNIEETTEE
ncbi:MAG: hypothetical protein LBH07_04940 [Treponema sp.]|nr:hypothetical protein [Treponema sp.]